MSKKKLTDIVNYILNKSDIIKENKIDVLDSEFVKEGPYRYLRVTIDKKNGVEIKDCEMVSKYLNAELDKIDPIPEQYFLEVTSPGVERQLKTDKDYNNNRNKEIKIRLFQPINGMKEFIAILEKKEKHIVYVNYEGKTLELFEDKIAAINLYDSSLMKEK